MSEADASDATLLAVLERLCDSVGEFHSRGLVIRDLSPTNLLVEIPERVGRYGRVKLLKLVERDAAPPQPSALRLVCPSNRAR